MTGYLLPRAGRAGLEVLGDVLGMVLVSIPRHVDILIWPLELEKGALEIGRAGPCIWFRLGVDRRLGVDLQ